MWRLRSACRMEGLRMPGNSLLVSGERTVSAGGQDGIQDRKGGDAHISGADPGI